MRVRASERNIIISLRYTQMINGSWASVDTNSEQYTQEARTSKESVEQSRESRETAGEREEERARR